MSIKAGLVGLPNVGKSTLFNALTKSSVPAENYPFCTIEPHIAITPVPDSRIEILKKIYQSKATIPATVTFVDIAGLVKGAASGEGLGNKFLSHIREVDLIIHVLRCFEDPIITHAGETIDPMADYEIIITELMLKDIESVEKKLAKIDREIKTAQGVEKTERETEKKLLIEVQTALNHGNASLVKELIKNAEVETVPLLSAKKQIIIANIGENDIEQYEHNIHYQTLVTHFGTDFVVPVCAKIAYELSQMNEQEADELMGLIGLKEHSLHAIIKKAYAHLGLITFFTCGPQEIHAWPIKGGTSVRSAAGEIHSDLEKGFIKAEVFNYHDLITCGGTVQKLKELGKVRTEGQTYIVQDGDLLLIRFNV